MPLIRSLNPHRFNAENLGRVLWTQRKADGNYTEPWNKLWSEERRYLIDQAQSILDAMVAEGILSTEEPYCGDCGKIFATYKGDS